MIFPIQKTATFTEVQSQIDKRRGVDSFDAALGMTPAEAELRAAIHANNRQRAVMVLEQAPLLRLHASQLRPIEQALDYWCTVCAGVDPL